MSERVFKYVLWRDVPRYHALGWFVCADLGLPHNQYSAYMERLCVCGAMPESPTSGGYATEPTIAGASLKIEGSQGASQLTIQVNNTRPATPPSLGPETAGSVAG